ncbi:hypothetical protein ACTGVI_11520 [Streptococcus suis]
MAIGVTSIKSNKSIKSNTKDTRANMKLTAETLKKLQFIKLAEGHKSLDETLVMLMEVYNDVKVAKENPSN